MLHGTLKMDYQVYHSTLLCKNTGEGNCRAVFNAEITGHLLHAERAKMLPAYKNLDTSGQVNGSALAPNLTSSYLDFIEITYDDMTQITH